MQLDRSGHAIGSLFKNDLHLVGTMSVKKQFDLPTDQGHRCLEQLAVEGDRAVFGDFSPDPLPEVIGQVVGGWSQTLQVVGKSGQRCLASTTVFTLVIDLVEPYLECGVEFDERTSVEAEHKIAAYGPEEAFDLPFPLGLVRFGVDQGNSQTGGHMLQMPTAERRAVVHV